MTCFPSRLAAIGGVLLLLVAAGCERYKMPGGSPGASHPPSVGASKTSTTTSSGERTSLPADPDEPAVKAVVEQALAARNRGDAEALKKLCLPHLAAKFDSLAPRAFDFKIRKVEVLSRKAKVEVWTRDPAFDQRDNQSLVTYDLVADVWR
jgi:hypothetical protein